MKDSITLDIYGNRRATAYINDSCVFDRSFIFYSASEVDRIAKKLLRDFMGVKRLPNYVIVKKYE